jgi:excisionase family DNA binding protein
VTPLAEQKLLDLAYIIEQTGLSARTWRRIISAGRIGFLRIEGSVRVPEEEFAGFLKERFTPARRDLPPATVESIIDSVVSRRRRPRISGQS